MGENLSVRRECANRVDGDEKATIEKAVASSFSCEFYDLKAGCCCGNNVNCSIYNTSKAKSCPERIFLLGIADGTNRGYERIVEQNGK